MSTVARSLKPKAATAGAAAQMLAVTEKQFTLEKLPGVRAAALSALNKQVQKITY